MTDIALPDPDELLTLAQACERLFRGAIKPSSLRAEHRRGRLAIERIGNKDFVTRRALQEMRKKCRLEPNHPDSISDQDDATRPAPTRGPGSSSTADGISPQDAFRAKLRTLGELSPTTSRRSTIRAKGRAGLLR